MVSSVYFLHIGVQLYKLSLEYIRALSLNRLRPSAKKEEYKNLEISSVKQGKIPLAKSRVARSQSERFKRF